MLMDIIKKRRSIRTYSSRPILRGDLLKCIEAARLAPSACNAQPWKFIIINDPGLKKSLCDVAFSGIFSLNRFAETAPVLIVVVSEKEKFLTAVGGYLRNIRYYLLDLGIACEHLVLQATELGIGSCWIGWFNEKAVKKILHIPKDKKIDIIICLGYVEGKYPEPKDRKSINQISSFNAYASDKVEM